MVQGRQKSTPGYVKLCHLHPLTQWRILRESILRSLYFLPSHKAQNLESTSTNRPRCLHSPTPRCQEDLKDQRSELQHNRLWL